MMALAKTQLPWLRGLCWLLVLAMFADSALGAERELPGATRAEAGLPLSHNFDAHGFNATPQNWSVTQGPDGLIYVGNVDDGVLVFDGVRWQRIPVPHNSTVRALASAPDGRIYVGTVGDFGYLAADPEGRLAYVSLLDQVPADARDFSDVWSIYAHGRDVYFATLKYVFHLRAGQLTVVRPETSFQLAFLVNGTFYIREIDRGLMQLDGDRLQLAPGGASFAQREIYALLPVSGHDGKSTGLLAATRTQGWFQFAGKQWHRWPTELDSVLPGYAVDGALRLADGRIAVALSNNGLALLDASGRILQRLTRAHGLGANMITAMFQGREHGLWLATGQGLTRIDVASPISRFDTKRGLDGAVLNIVRQHETLYANTTNGLFRLVTTTPGDTHFEQVPGIPGWGWLIASHGQLLASGSQGLYAIESDGTSRQIITPNRTQHLATQALLQSRTQPDRVLVGYTNGLGAIRFIHGEWVDEGPIAGVDGEPDSLVQASDGQVWVSLWGGGIERLTLPPGWTGPQDPRPVQVAHFGTSAGIPAGALQMVMIDDQVRAITSRGIYAFDAQQQRFVPDPRFSHLFPDGPRQIFALRQDPAGRLWMYTDNGVGNLKQSGYAERVNGRWQWRLAPLQPLAGNAMITIYADADGVVWLGGFQGLFRYDPIAGPAAAATFSTLIRKVVTHAGRALPLPQRNAAAPTIPFAHNALRIEFAAPSYDDFAANRFQVMLDGSDAGWSAWSQDASRDYTNLDAGTYQFRVRARNVYGKLGSEADFSFRVLPPWYRTWWAWLLWATAGSVALGGAARVRSTTLRHRNRSLAALVDLRTAELAQANDALKESNRALEKQSVTDPLTGLKNRRYLYDHIAQDIAVLHRQRQDQTHGESGTAASPGILFLMVDVDHFKEINDRYGHAAGDRVLEQMRDALQAATRDSDILVRWGGEEFLIVAHSNLPDAGPQFAERIRSEVARRSFDLGENRAVQRTCSIGFASYPAARNQPDAVAWEQIVSLADACMYAAKAHGRNAWAGMLPLQTLPDGNLAEALHTALATISGPRPLQIRTSWPQHG